LSNHWDSSDVSSRAGTRATVAGGDSFLDGFGGIWDRYPLLIYSHIQTHVTTHGLLRGSEPDREFPGKSTAFQPNGPIPAIISVIEFDFSIDIHRFLVTFGIVQ
jgi:hypothetical protein